MEPVSGRKLGRYTLTRRLGAGGMAEVWEATDELLKRRVAVKIVRAALSESREFASRFLREARLAAQLQHAHVVAVYDVGLEAGSLFVVMPVLAGGSLADRLAGPFDDRTALAWLRALASALDFAHGRGIVHRDVKPLNVLFDEAGEPHLSDFGLARGLDEATQLTQTGVLLGTPLYMSPEQAMGTPAGPAADQYSLGVLAYRLLAGRLPYEKEPTPVLLRRTVFEEMPPPSRFRGDLPTAVDAVFSRVLAKAPEARFGSCSGFVASLARALPHGGDERTTPLEPEATRVERALASDAPGASAGRTPPPPASPPFRRARRLPAGALLLGALFLGLLGVALTIVLREAPPPKARPDAPLPAPTRAAPTATPSPTASPTPRATPTVPAAGSALLVVPPRGKPSPSPTTPPTPTTPAPTLTPTPLPAPTPTPLPPATPAPSPTRPVPADPLARVPRRPYPPGMRVKDAWVVLEKMGSHTLHFRFTDDLEGKGESVGWFGSLAVSTRGDAPLLPGARYPIPLVCSGLDGTHARCLVPAADAPRADASPRLGTGDRVLVRAVLAGFSFSATLRFED